MSTKVPVKNDWQKACDGVLSSLAMLGYSKKSVNLHSCLYNHLLSFLNQRKLIDKPVDKKHVDAFLQFYYNTSCSAQTKEYYICVLRRLLEFHQRGSFDQRRFNQRREVANQVLLSPSYEAILAEYQGYRVTEIASASEHAERQYLRDVRIFLHCLCERRVTSLRRICFDDVQAFIKKNPKHSSSRISFKTHALRSFFRFLIITQRGTSTLLKFIPRIHRAGAFRLAAIWPQPAVKKLLSVIDRKTNLGKRDYAIILLISKLGLRIGDVLNLRIENINWRKATIHITQPKTKNILELPISEEIGNALIDYLLNGRPSVSSRHVFVAHLAPYRDFSTSRGLAQGNILAKYRKKAGITLQEGSRQSWHSLRHSLATRLHEEKTPFPVIATILGHTSVETTRLNVEMLQSVALEWEES